MPIPGSYQYPTPPAGTPPAETPPGTTPGTGGGGGGWGGRGGGWMDFISALFGGNGTFDPEAFRSGLQGIWSGQNDRYPNVWNGYAPANPPTAEEYAAAAKSWAPSEVNWDPTVWTNASPEQKRAMYQRYKGAQAAQRAASSPDPSTGGPAEGTTRPADGWHRADAGIEPWNMTPESGRRQWGLGSGSVAGSTGTTSSGSSSAAGTTPAASTPTSWLSSLLGGWGRY